MSSFSLQDFKEFLRQKTGYVKETEKDIICRCPFCGDSVKNKNKGHLYISKDLDVFHCFRCDEAGPVSLLLQLLEYDGPVPPSTKKSASKVYAVRQSRSLKFPLCNEPYKQDYLISRGVDLDKELMYRIVWRLDTFLEENYIQLNIDYGLLKLLSEYYVGFLTYFGERIIFRRIDTVYNDWYRYYNIRIGNKLDYYVLNNYDYRDFPTVVVSEGVFDTIAAYNKLNYEQSVFVSALSKGFASAFFWTCYAFVLTKVDLVLVLDNDVSVERYKWLAKNKFVRSLKFVIPKDGKDIAESEQFIEVDI